MISAKVPRKLACLLKPARYKGAYGGRGGAKSHFFAEQLIIKCYQKETRAVCIREVQNSIKDSVRQLLMDKVSQFGMGHLFTAVDNEIRGTNGSLIIFRGMQSFNAANIKSLENYQVAWVEEAQTLSQHSLDLLRPTIRALDSELWFSWNPRFKTDPVDKFFRKTPPPDAVSTLINWRDNPWFPDVLRSEMTHDFIVDQDKADHIWNGAYGGTQGAILSRWVNKAERDGRIGSVEFDPNGAGIDISCDIGFRDTASFWYWQRCLGGYRVLKYDGASGMDAPEWIERIQGNLRKMGLSKLLNKVWLPHDSRAKTFQSKYTSMEQFLTAFGASHVDVVPISKKSDQINAAREVIDQCEFDRIQCETGLDGLLAWEFEYSEDNNVYSREPKHNWASHPSDAFAYGCQVMQKHKLPVPGIETKTLIVGPANEVTMDDMWAIHKTNQRSARI